MSVFRIYYKNGAKMMAPVTTEEEYRQLRGTAVQKQLVSQARLGNQKAKQHLLQFCYSCIPGEDGALKGCKTPSTCVGMDIDFVENPKSGNLENSEKKDVYEAVRETVLSKKEELGLLMLERSASKGFHLVFRRQPELSQEENLRWASNLLGVPFDEGAKDITRVFFSTTDSAEDLIFLDKEIFELTAAPNVIQTTEGRKNLSCLNGSPSRDSSSATPPLNDIKDDKGAAAPIPNTEYPIPSTESNKKAFDLCVAQAGLSPEHMDVWGEHNWHTNLMAVLSVGLPKLMSREQLEAVVAERLPNYAQTEDCRTLIAYFYDNYSADKGFMTSALREINAKAQETSPELTHTRETRNSLSTSSEGGDVEVDLTEGWTPPLLPKRIPRLLELLVKNFDPRFREVLCLSALPVLSAHASHFRARYLSGCVIGPQQYVAVIGGSGSGKKNVTDLYQQMIKHTLDAHDQLEWKKVDENAELRDKMKNSDKCPAKYHPRLRLFETTSKTSILELQKNLGENGMLLGQFSEVDGLSSAARTAFSDISVILRKGWDGDVHRQFYMSEASCNTCAQMNISLLMSGTVKAMLERMFSDTNCEGGLMQRCIPVLMPKTKRTFRPPMQNFLTEDECKERDALLVDLFQKDLALENNTLLLELPQTNKAIGEWFDELEERYNDGELTEAEADLSHRCGEFMLRAAIPLVALYGRETKEIVNFCRWVGEMAHYALCRIFGMRVQRDIQSANELLADHKDCRKTAEPLLDKMPEVFTIKEFKELRVREGQSPEVKMLLSRYVKNGKLTRLGRGMYRKGNGNI